MRYLFIIPALLVVFILLISVYLEPNDLKKCSNTPSSLLNCQKADAIVAVSGGDTNARADEAVRLYKSGWANFLIFSGAALDKSGPSNAEAMMKRAVGAGISPEVILLDATSETTKENATNTSSIFSSNGIKDAILVTSGYHQRRASIEFLRNTAGVAIRNSPVSSDKDWSGWWWLTPRGWYLAVTELIKVVALNFEVGK